MCKGGKLGAAVSLCVLVCCAALLEGCSSGGSASTPIPVGPTPAPEFLFADSAEGVQAFSIDSASGNLTALASFSDTDLSRFITGNMLTAASGKFLLVTDSGASNVKVFSINLTTGALTPVAGSPFAIGGRGGGSLSLDPSGQYLYAPYLNGVAAFRFNSSTGALSPLAGSPFSDGSSPLAGAVDPSGKFYYTTGSTAQTGLSVYSLNAGTGALAAIAGSPFATPLGNPPYNLVVSPAGGSIYATVPSNNALLGISINLSSGAPSPIPGSPFSAGITDLFLGLNPAGTFLYACNEGNGSMSAYTITSGSGKLTPIAGTPSDFASCDTTVAVDSSGKFLYTAYPEGNLITGFSIDGTTGSLTMLAGSPFTSIDATLLTIATVQ
jgi:6-phosphogluconolactonase